MSVDIIPPRVDFIDPRTGKIAREWYLFLLNNVTRLDASDLEMLGLQQAPVVQPEQSTSQETLLASLIARYDTLISAIEASYLTPPQALGDASVSSLNVSKSVQVTGSSAPSSGTGVETYYSGGTGGVIAYDRNANTFKPLGVAGSTVTFYTGPAATALTNTQMGNSGGTDVNYVSISSNTTGLGPVITASGETNVQLNVRGKGTGPIALASDTYNVATFSGNSANYFKLTNSASNPVINTSDGGVLLQSVNKSVALFGNSGGTDVNYISFSSNVTATGPIITAAGETNVTLHLRSKGSGNVIVGADGNPIAQFTGGTGGNYMTLANAANDPVLSVASAGAIKVPTTVQITNYAVPTAGAGVEIGYDTGTPLGFIQAYDRTGAAWKNIGMSGYNVSLTAQGGNVVIDRNGGNVVLSSLPGFSAGDKYLIIDASGNVHVSAVGPAS